MAFLDFLFPKYSLLEKEGTFVTPSELSRLISHPRLFSEAELKKMGMPSLDRVFAVSTYSEAPLLRKAIHTLKYRRMPGVGDVLQDVLKSSFQKHMGVRSDACVCPVPLHFTREFWRGFNQAEILAKALSESLRLPLRHLLRRVRPTGHQARRSREERLGAMKGAFRVRAGARAGAGDVLRLRSALTELSVASLSMTHLIPRPYPRPLPYPLPFCVYLVDDLFTTGATMEECAKVLKAAGVKRVEGVVLAHG